MYRLFEKIPFLKNRLTGKSLVNILMVTLALILIILDISPGRVFCFEALIFSALGDAVLELGFPSRKKNNGYTMALNTKYINGIKMTQAKIFKTLKIIQE